MTAVDDDGVRPPPDWWIVTVLVVYALMVVGVTVMRGTLEPGWPGTSPILAISVALLAVLVVAHHRVTGLPWRDPLGRRAGRNVRFEPLDFAVTACASGGLIAGGSIVGIGARGDVPALVLGALVCAAPFLVLASVRRWGRAGRAARRRSDGRGERRPG
ncbi:hypothetical protein [Pseudonocardia humida]|uniref:Uncharacterized protein n=1 Tax=Pseudonocardia humida TaxID=2800819 RepID=A0ABT1A948_9PSEU|nr:hypothetical protein [Pseudonocardia humida]MCO1659542.1 hypothetical protein [Pseudonocardia humida]